MTRPILFIDDGGVLNETPLLIAQWETLVGECMPILLGGTVEAWTNANRTVLAGRLFGDRLLAWTESGMSYREAFRL